MIIKKYEHQIFFRRKHSTVDGLKSILELIDMYGNPTVSLNYASIEVVTKNLNMLTIVVDRLIDVSLIFNDKIHIKGLNKRDIKVFETYGYLLDEVKTKVRHPSCLASKMMMATKKEINDYIKNQ